MGVTWLGAVAARVAGADGTVAGRGAVIGGLEGQGGMGVAAQPASRAAVAMSANLLDIGQGAFRQSGASGLVKVVVMLDTYLRSL